MNGSKWSDDAFLDALRQQADPLADAAVARLTEEGGIAAANHAFRHMHADGKPLPDDTPAPLREFLEMTGELPPGIDEARLDRAGADFFEHALTGAVVMLASSLPQGYCAPCLCEILTISNDLKFHPFKRLMGVIQLLVNLASPHAFKPGGLAIESAQKMRLLHAGVRSVAHKYRPGFTEKYGRPVNHEDMLATLMAFSHLVLEGHRTLNVGFTPEQEEDYYYMWRIFARMVGIHPDGRSDDDSFIPATLEEAGLFYEAFARRNYTMPDENPSGPVLAQENLKMMESLVPKALRLIGFGKAPRIVMTHLLSPEIMARLDLEPDTGHSVIEKLTERALRGVQWAMDREPSLAELLARHLFQDMIDYSRGGEVTFVIPDSLASLRGSGLV